MKLARTIRFDKSDLNIFDVSSEEGEWAISGAFEYSKDSESSLIGKRKQGFSNGFMGLGTFGRSTFVSISKLSIKNKKSLLNELAQYFMEFYGAPNIEVALPVAEEEIDFMIDLCDEHDVGTLLTVNRTLGVNGIHEKFRHLPKQDSCSSQQIWATVEDD